MRLTVVTAGSTPITSVARNPDQCKPRPFFSLLQSPHNDPFCTSRPLRRSLVRYPSFYTTGSMLPQKWTMTGILGKQTRACVCLSRDARQSLLRYHHVGMSSGRGGSICLFGLNWKMMPVHSGLGQIKRSILLTSTDSCNFVSNRHRA